MKRILILSLAAALAFPATAVSAQPLAASPAETVARQMAPRLPNDVGGGTVIVAARAEGPMLIVTAQFAAGTADAQVAAFERTMLDGMCRGAPHLFRQGLVVRLDAVVGAAPARQGRMLNLCGA